ncbi:MAG: hypothetical protein RL030_655 [Pseudomonadota bacterium]
MVNRRTMLAATASLLAARGTLAQGLKPTRSFPAGFLWGAASAGHQVEGNNVASDLWLLEQMKPTVFAEPSGDAVNSFALWPRDLDLAREIGLNSYRFSIEWSRIEPEPGQFSVAMLDHYKAMIEGCRARGLEPIVTFNHFTSPRWFAARGGWLNRDAPDLFAVFCERAARHLAKGIAYAVTFNEPNLMRLLRSVGLPLPVQALQREMLAAAARATGTPRFVAANAANFDDVDAMLPVMIKAHEAARVAIKSARGDLPVGLSLAMFDDQAVGDPTARDRARKDLYSDWLAVAKRDDFFGVQNYEPARYDANGRLPPPPGAKLNWNGSEVYAPSLAGAVRYAHEVTQVPILVTEHGVGTDDDPLRSDFIPAALAELKKVMDSGVPVRGYVHWSLLDNFEWIFGYKPHYGLASVDRKTFVRTAKPSAGVLGAIARRNGL